MQEMTVNDYAKQRGITPQGVHQQIRKGRSLPAVTEVKKFGSNYMLIVDEKELSRLPKGRYY